MSMPTRFEKLNLIEKHHLSDILVYGLLGHVDEMKDMLERFKHLSLDVPLEFDYVHLSQRTLERLEKCKDKRLLGIFKELAYDCPDGLFTNDPPQGRYFNMVKPAYVQLRKFMVDNGYNLPEHKYPLDLEREVLAVLPNNILRARKHPPNNEIVPIRADVTAITQLAKAIDISDFRSVREILKNNKFDFDKTPYRVPSESKLRQILANYKVSAIRTPLEHAENLHNAYRFLAENEVHLVEVRDYAEQIMDLIKQEQKKATGTDRSPRK